MSPAPGEAPGPAGDPPLPAYGEAALSDLTPSVLAALGVPGETNVLGLPPSPRACLLLVDGLGWQHLRDRPEAAPYLSSLVAGGRALTAGFPATTATSMGSLGTGLVPGRHGLVGLRVAVPGEARLMHCLRWDDKVPAADWQPHPTIFDRAEAAGVAASHVAPSAFRDGGLTRAVLRGCRYVPADSPGELVAGADAALRAAERAFAFVYYAELDSTGHRKGCGSDAWRYQLAHVDRLAEQLAAALPSDTRLYITADHGMVDVDPADRFDADAVPALREGVALLGGEARARHVYARPGAAADVLATWRELVGDRMWVASRDEAVAAGWFGPSSPASSLPGGGAPGGVPYGVPYGVLERIGDVVAASRDGIAVIASRAEEKESALVGQHGSMTPAEQLVPLLTYPDS